MANLAQTINVLQCLLHTDGERLWKTPTYHVFDLYQAHMGHEAVECLVEAPAVSSHRSDGREVDLPLLSASASVAPDRQSVAVTLTNRSLAEPMTVKLDWVGVDPPGTVTARVLSADAPADHNTAEAPEAVTTREWDAAGAQAVEVPAMGVIGLVLRAAADG
jgi:alpha-N-arabinofuranosidase